MSDRLISRPGLLGSNYPERLDERLTPLDRTWAGIIAWCRQLGAGRRAVSGGFVWRVRTAEARLSKLSDNELQDCADSLANELKLGGLTQAKTVRAFALVSEMSYRILGMRHFNVQLLGGRTLLSGCIAEMETGEGKTLTATLAASTMAMSGVPVHVVTVNDFLATRDARWMGRLYRALGLSVGVVTEGMADEERRAAYACDITYCTNKQLAFDYLKDRLLMQGETRPMHMALRSMSRAGERASVPLMRGVFYAIIDEADSVLIDEARTPLIITRRGDLTMMEEAYIKAIDIARSLQAPRDFGLNERKWTTTLTDLGKAQVRRQTRHFGGIWSVELHREELIRQALAALHLYRRDKHYIVDDGQVRIVDEYTGRIMADRSWERGLHQMIEVKEGCELSSRQETLIRISYQKFFRRYLKLAGMTGTAREIAPELEAVYRLKTRRISTNRRSRRRDLGQKVYTTETAKWCAVVREIRKIHGHGRPVLVGTQSVADSEHLSELLLAEGLEHRVLNARQNAEEAEIIENAGNPGRITVATNMAGRGTDIVLPPEAVNAGGLHVIATGRHDARRIDRQLYGRCARQGDPGTHITYVSLEDDLVRLHLGRAAIPLKSAFRILLGRVPGVIADPLVRSAQRAAERRHSQLRQSLLRADESLEDLLSFSGMGE